MPGKKNPVVHFQKAYKERLLSEALAERRATPSFDGSPVPDNALLTIVKSGVESPSGYNLQPWRFIIVRDAKQKRHLCSAAMNQGKVEQAGAIIVCCGDLDAPRDRNLDKVLAESARHGFSENQNKQTKETISKVFGAPAGNAMGIAPDYAVWVNRHVMIAFTTMMWTAETLGFDTAPMEGFFEDKVKTVLGIPDHVRVVALLAIGKRKGADKSYAGRRELKDLCFSEKWGEVINF